MLTRTDTNRVEAAVEKNFDPKQYTWHKYTSARGTKLKGLRGSEVVLRKGDLYGVKEYNSKQDMYLVLKMPSVVFKVSIAGSDKIMNDKSVELKGKKPTLPKNPPKKIKIDMSPKEKKTVKKAAEPKTAKAPKADKPKLTANQKKIAAVKLEIKRLRGLTQNASNLRKIAAQKAELKKLNLKEKMTATPKAKPTVEKKPTAASKQEKVKKEQKTAPNPSQDVPMKDLPPEIQAAKKMIDAIDNGGVPLNPVKLNNIGRDLGLEISRSAKPEDTIKRIRDAIQRAIDTARAEAKTTHAPVDPLKEMRKNAKPSKVTIQTRSPFIDEDDEEIPTGHVRYGGKLIEPDELEFDDDIDGLVDMPIDESWSGDKSQTSESGARKSKRMILEEDDETEE